MNKKYDHLSIPEKYFALQALHAQVEDLRLAAVNKLSNQEILETVALTDSSPQIRLRAVEKLDQENILKQIASSDQASDVALAACRKLKTLALLQDVSYSSPHWEVRLFTLKKGTFPPDHLIYLTLTDASPEVRATAFSQLDKNEVSEALLEHIGLTDPSPLVRGQAMLNITSSEKLLTIFENESDMAVRKAIITNPHIPVSFLLEKLEDITLSNLRLDIVNRLSREITDSDTLLQIVLIDPRTLAESLSDFNMQILVNSIYEALKRLPQDKLLSVIQHSSSSLIRARAVSLIKNSEVLANLARQESSSDVKMGIIENPNTPAETILDFAKADSKVDIRFLAISNADKHTEDPLLLSEFVMLDPSQLSKKNTKYSTKRFAQKLVDIVSLIHNQEVLMQVALEAPASLVRATAVEQTQNPDIINSVALKDGSPIVRISAIRNPLISQSTLLHVLNRDLDFRVCQNAVDFLQDEKILAEFAQTAIEKGQSGYTKRLKLRAVRRITSQKLLGQIALLAALPTIRQETIKRITDVQVLTDIALKTMEITDGQLVLKKLRSSKQHLAAVRLSAKLRPLRNLARQKLEQLA
ncbi:MAG: hypothetical protein ACFFBD_08340 [Candidatus Hodarchaeota archaeon]